MTPEELKPIVKEAGGIEQFARLIDATPRAVTSWLTGQRKMSPITAKLIRIVQAAKINTQCVK